MLTTETTHGQKMKINTPQEFITTASERFLLEENDQPNADKFKYKVETYEGTTYPYNFFTKQDAERCITGGQWIIQPMLNISEFTFNNLKFEHEWELGENSDLRDALVKLDDIITYLKNCSTMDRDDVLELMQKQMTEIRCIQKQR